MRFFDRAQSSPPGFTIIESVISIGLLTVAIAMAVSLMLAVQLTETVQNTAIANRVASRQIENIRAQQWASIVNTSTPIIDSALALLTKANGTTTISDYLATSTLKQVTVQIRWFERGGPKIHRIDTVVVNGGTNPQ